jgi:hypothetical protein
MPFSLPEQLMLLAGVPLHIPLLLHVSGVVHSFPSLQAVPGVQLPAHVPPTQACAEHALHATVPPPPHTDVVWLATAMHELPLQQPPPVHEVESHTQLPLEQRCPVEQG